MNLIEIKHPAGSLTQQDRQTVAADITAGLVGDGVAADGVAEETMRRARATTHVGFAELADWRTGDGIWHPGQSAAPLWLTVTVPGQWQQEIARPLIGLIRRAVRRLDERRGWQRGGGELWINITGIADGSIGLNGKPMTADGVLEYMTEEFRARPDDGPELPEGVVVDPMCGMQVRLGPRAITLDRGDSVHGFCAESCRGAYARAHGLEVPS